MNVICPACASRKFEIEIQKRGKKHMVILTCECKKFHVNYIVGESEEIR